MRNKIIISSVFLMLIKTTFCQTNLYWKLGYHTGVSFKSGNCVVNANDTCNMQMNNSNTGVCDNRGNLIFYSNGLLVKNRLDQTMPNGDNFNHGTVSDTYIPQGWMPPYNIATVVPFPNDTNKFYMFYENLEYSINGSDFPNKLRYLVVDKSLNGGLGDVTQKEVDLITDTLYDGQLHAIKHGNGKDYWLIARKYKSNIFYKVLINSSGVSVLDTQAIGMAYPVCSSCGIYTGQSTSSLQGDKLAYIYQVFSWPGSTIPNGQLDIIDFDRCSGIITKIDNVVLPINATDSVEVLFSCFSPSGRYIYTNDISKMFQFDTYNINMIANRIKLGNDTSWNFGQMQIAPDNKVYCAGYGASQNMHVINAPDSLGLACNFVQNQIYFGGNPHYSSGGLPNVPNFALGAINCNVGVEELKTENEKIKVYPNPCEEKLSVVGYQLLGNTKLEVMDVLGRKFENFKMSKFENEIQIQVSDLASGIYFLKATDDKGLQQVVKFVKE